MNMKSMLVFKAYVMNADDDPLYNPGYFELHNFKADGTDLKLMSIASGIEYLAFEKLPSFSRESPDSFRKRL